jgi:hypothetical protein
MTKPGVPWDETHKLSKESEAEPASVVPERQLSRNIEQDGVLIPRTAVCVKNREKLGVLALLARHPPQSWQKLVWVGSGW